MRILAFALAALTLATPAAAQDGSEMAGARTVESAQRFLSETFGAGRFPVWMHLKSVEGIYRPQMHQFRTPEGFIGSGVTQSWIATDQCNSVLTVSGARPVYDDPDFQKVAYDSPPQVIAFQFQWDRVSHAVAHETASPVLVRQTEDPPVQRSMFAMQVSGDPEATMLPIFYFPTSDLAKRVAFAMEYLREQCAPKSDTGF